MNRREFAMAIGAGLASSAAAAPVPKDIDPGIGKLLIIRGTRFRLIDPDGKNESDIPGLAELKSGTIPTLQCASLSPDGKRLAWIYADPKRGTKLYIRDFDATGPGEFVHDLFKPLNWIGPNELVIRWDSHDPKETPEWRHHIYNVVTKKTTPLKLPADESPMTVLPDGAILGYRNLGFDRKLNRSMAETLLHRGSEAPKSILKDGATDAYGCICVSPDGKRVAYCRSDPNVGWPSREHKWELFVQTLDGTKPIRLDTVPEGFAMSGLEWEPSGKRLAYTMSLSSQVTPGDERSSLRVIDANGGKPKAIAEHDPAAQDWRNLRLVEWR